MSPAAAAAKPKPKPKPPTQEELKRAEARQAIEDELRASIVWPGTCILCRAAAGDADRWLPCRRHAVCAACAPSAAAETVCAHCIPRGADVDVAARTSVDVHALAVRAEARASALLDTIATIRDRRAAALAAQARQQELLELAMASLRKILATAHTELVDRHARYTEDHVTELVNGAVAPHTHASQLLAVIDLAKSVAEATDPIAVALVAPLLHKRLKALTESFAHTHVAALPPMHVAVRSSLTQGLDTSVRWNGL